MSPLSYVSTFTKNRDRLLNEELMARFLELPMASPEVKPLLSSEHFSVDGTLLRAWASHSSIERFEQVFGWINQASGLRQLKARGRSRVGAVLRLHVVAYNLIRLANLLSPQDKIVRKD